MVGDNAMDVQPMPPDSQPIPGKAFAWSFAQQFWTTAIPNVCMRSHGYDLSPYVTQSAGPEFAFARVLLGMGVTNRIGFMPAAMNGQSLSIDYQPGEGHYNDVIRNTRDAMAAIGKQAVLRGALWVQVRVDRSCGRHSNNK